MEKFFLFQKEEAYKNERQEYFEHTELLENIDD